MYSLKYFQFISPFTLLISGPSGSGKTQLVRRILKHHTILMASRKDILKIDWFHGQWQKEFDEPVSNCEITYYDFFSHPQKGFPDMIIFDDLMNEMGDDKRLGNFFTKESHHKGINVIFITQNLFNQGKQMRNIHLNCHYLIIMKNPRDAS